MPKAWRPFKTQELPDDQGVLFHNNWYHVIVRKYPNPREGGPDIIHLSIRDNERTSRHDWRHFQRIKNEVLGWEYELVEMYPRESQVVDMSNQYHLFGFLTEEPLFTRMGLCWEQGRAIWDGIHPRPNIPDSDNSIQRPIREANPQDYANLLQLAARRKEEVDAQLGDNRREGKE